MIHIPDQGIKLRVSGKAPKTGAALSKVLHVTQAKKCQDWLRYDLEESGHESNRVAGVAAHAKSLGYSAVEIAEELPGRADKPQKSQLKPAK